MILSKLFPPKWKHKSPQVRKRTLLALNAEYEASQTIYFDVVKHDPELFIRRIALQRLNDIDQVQSFRENNSDKEIYEEATKRLCELLSGHTSKYTVQQLADRLRHISEYRVFEYVARHSKNNLLQKIAIEKIDNDTVLVDVIAVTASEENRQFALNKITSVNALKNVIKLFKRKDKHIVALAQEKIDLLNSKREGARSVLSEYKRVANDFLELIQLCKLSGEWEKYNVRFRGLFEQWHSLRILLDDNATSQLQELASTVEQSYVYFEEKLKQQQSNLPNAQGWEVEQTTDHGQMLETLRQINKRMEQQIERGIEIEPERIASTRDQLQNLFVESRNQWYQIYNELSEKELTSVQEKDFQEINSAYQSNNAKLSSYVGNLAELQQYAAKLEKISSESSQLLASEDPDSRGQINELVGRLLKLNKQTIKQFAPQLSNKTEHLLNELNAKAAHWEQQDQQLTEEFTALNQQLRSAIESGRSRHAGHLINRGKKIMRSVSSQAKNKLDKQGEISRFNQLLHSTTELQSWREWSSDAVKEKLIMDMQHFADRILANKENPDFDYDDAADSIKKARLQWQDVQAGDPKTDDELWQEFNAACNRAYEPCQSHFDKINQQRDNNLAQRENICADLERYRQKILETDPDTVDWVALGKIVRTARQDWKNLGEIQRADWAKINERFSAVLKELNLLLIKRRDSNREQKNKFINQVESLLSGLKENSIMIDQAINSVKHIQSQWKQVGEATKDKQLWVQFKNTCDQVFSIRKEEQSRKDEELQAEQQSRQGIIDSIQQLLSQVPADLSNSGKAFKDYTNQWQQLPALTNRDPLQRQYNSLCNKYHEAVQITQNQQLKIQKQRMRHNADLCYAMEKQIFNFYNGSISSDQLTESIAELHRHWQQTDVKLLKVARQVDAWFERLAGYVDTINQGDRALIEQIIQSQLQTTAKSKDNLCIQLEILAGVESPQDSKQTRIEYQVAHMADSMKQTGKVDVPARIEQLLTQWYSSGFVLPEAAQALEQRFYSVLRRLDKDYE